jgi:hypothetical protein
MSGSGPDFQEAMLHTRMFERKENDVPAHNGSVREGRIAFFSFTPCPAQTGGEVWR